jgi:ketosteroid isomerase-like protein
MRENMQRDTNIGSVRRFFDFMHAKDIDGWAALWANDGQILVAYPPDGFPDSIKGLDQIAAGFRQLFAHFGTYDFLIKALYPATDPDIVIVEWDVTASLPAQNQIYRGNNITVFKFRAGLIAEYHDYFDPRKFQVVVNSLAAPI